MMQVKRYVAATFAEALIQAKNELGTDAVIVESRKLRVGGIFGLFGREMTELTVAVDQPPVARPVPRQGYQSSTVKPAPRVQVTPAVQPSPVVQSSPAVQPSPAIQPSPAVQPSPVAHPTHAVQQTHPTPTAEPQFLVQPQPAAQPQPLVQPAPVALPTAVPAPLSGASVVQPPGDPSAPLGAFTGIQQEMADLKAAVTRLVESRPDPTALRELRGYGLEVFDRLVEIGVEDAIALMIGRRLMEAGAGGEEAFGQELAQLMGARAPIQVEPGQRRIVALVGPTGVGKTTTLAKLAAHFTLERGLRVGLITADTFRIAAVEQLRTYADILSIPVYAVEEAAEAARALAEIGEVDLVLIDTGGRSHKDEERMAELQELLAVVEPDEIHLVISLNTNPRDVYRMLEHYLPLGANRFIFTKVDEASSPGLILNIQQKWAQPVSYVTDGQSVPDDLIAGDQIDYVKLFMGA